MRAFAEAFPDEAIVKQAVSQIPWGHIIRCHESRTLAALRDALLPKLISGEIRVRDAERFLKERSLA
jgi:hypothetical protein